MPISMMPFSVTSRFESSRKWRGTHESAAMLESTARAAEESGVGGDEEQRASEVSTTISAPPVQARAAGIQLLDDRLEQDGVQGLARLLVTFHSR